MSDSEGEAEVEEARSEGTNADSNDIGGSPEESISSTDGEEEQQEPLACTDAREALVGWSLHNNITHNAIDDLLHVLRTIDPTTLQTIPLTARTLLKTYRDVVTERIDQMELIRVDVRASILDNFLRYPQATRDRTHVIDIILNVDGLPVNNSTTKTFWPLLCCLKLDPAVVFPLLLSIGPPKPKTPNFYQQTIEELRDVLATGIEADGRQVQLRLKAVVTDAPARALLKCVFQYSAYYGCDKCSTRGEYVWTLTAEEQRTKQKRGGGRVTFQATENLPLRTDADFRNKVNLEHHLPNLVSPMLCLPVDMIKDFPVDYMHQVCLDVMKKLLSLWIPVNSKDRVVSAANQERADVRLLRLKPCVSSDFARKPRPLTDYNHWKATELRQFFLYTGRHVMKGILPPRHFDHFSAFSVACCMLVSPTLVLEYSNFEHELLKFFVEEARALYGRTVMTYNLHAMLHLTDEAQRYGSLDYCSAFPFENHLYQLKKKVKPGRKPLVQAYNRLCEASLHFRAVDNRKKAPLRTKSPENHYITQAGCCVSVMSIEDEDTVMVQAYPRSHPLFERPCDSRLIGIHKIQGHALPVLQLLQRNELKQKAVKFSVTDGHVFHGVLHTFN